MIAEPTTAVVQRYLDALDGDQPAEPIVHAVLAPSVRRLQVLCGSLLYRQYRRLTLPPLNSQPDEMLSAVVERLLRAVPAARPRTVRQFFALVDQHMRWELNDLARRPDEQPAVVELDEGRVPAPPGSGSVLTPDGRRMLEAIDRLPEEEREAFGLVRIQGLTYGEAGEVLGVSTKTVRRRLNRSLVLLAHPDLLIAFAERLTIGSRADSLAQRPDQGPARRWPPEIPTGASFQPSMAFSARRSASYSSQHSAQIDR